MRRYSSGFSPCAATSASVISGSCIPAPCCRARFLCGRAGGEKWQSGCAPPSRRAAQTQTARGGSPGPPEGWADGLRVAADVGLEHVRRSAISNSALVQPSLIFTVRLRRTVDQERHFLVVHLGDHVRHPARRSASAGRRRCRPPLPRCRRSCCPTTARCRRRSPCRPSPRWRRRSSRWRRGWRPGRCPCASWVTMVPFKPPVPWADTPVSRWTLSGWAIAGPSIEVSSDRPMPASPATLSAKAGTARRPARAVPARRCFRLVMTNSC